MSMDVNGSLAEIQNDDLLFARILYSTGTLYIPSLALAKETLQVLIGSKTIRLCKPSTGSSGTLPILRIRILGLVKAWQVQGLAVLGPPGSKALFRVYGF